MSAEWRPEANMQNAQLSMGPRTANDKTRVASNAPRQKLTDQTSGRSGFAA